MKTKTAVTLLFWVVIIAVAYAAVKRSGLDRAFGSLLTPSAVGDIGSSRPSVVADLVSGPLSGSGPGGGPGSFGVTSSPVGNTVGVVAATVPVSSPGAPASGALSPAVAVGTIGPTIATRVAQHGEFIAPSMKPEVVAIPVGSYVSTAGTPLVRAETVQFGPSNWLESLPITDPRSPRFLAGGTPAAAAPISAPSTSAGATAAGAVITGPSRLSLPGVGAISLPGGLSPGEFLRRLGG